MLACGHRTLTFTTERLPLRGGDQVRDDVERSSDDGRSRVVGEEEEEHAMEREVGVDLGEMGRGAKEASRRLEDENGVASGDCGGGRGRRS